MERLSKRVGFVATGEELITGDVLNSNGHYFAQILYDSNIQPGQQITVGDEKSEICQAIQYILTNHDALITIGGLGPTADDITRYGLSDAINTPLEFNARAWQWIVDMLHSKGLNIPETNRQQALLPQKSEPIYNPNGTAAACYMQHKGKDIFMLPGPPNECMPIFKKNVLPILFSHHYAFEKYRITWLLFGVSESNIASELEPLMIEKDCRLGYRVRSPYLEIKLIADNPIALKKQSDQFNAVLQKNLISKQCKTASQQLIEKIAAQQLQLIIEDHATQGSIEALLISPNTYPYIHFHNTSNSDRLSSIQVKLLGLTEYWEQKSNTKQIPLSIHIQTKTQLYQIEKNIPQRGRKTLDYTVELICWEIFKILNNPS